MVFICKTIFIMHKSIFDGNIHWYALSILGWKILCGFGFVCPFWFQANTLLFRSFRYSNSIQSFLLLENWKNLKSLFFFLHHSFHMDENRKSLIFLIYLSNTCCLHITPWSILAYWERQYQFGKNFFKFELHLTVELHYFFHFASCKLQK